MFEQTIQDATRAEILRVEHFVAQRDDALAVPRVAAEFLHTLVLAGGYRRGLEIGTSYGYSGLWIAAALQHNGGALTTIDHDADKVPFARDAFQRAGLADTVDVVQGAAGAVLDDIHGPFDIVFIDADKESSRRYFDRVWSKMAQRATIVTDNATSHADDLADYLQYLRNHPRLCSTLLPIGSGMEVSVKLEPYATTASIDGADWVI